jgi:hypothetical protein
MKIQMQDGLPVVSVYLDIKGERLDIHNVQKKHMDSMEFLVLTL